MKRAATTLAPKNSDRSVAKRLLLGLSGLALLLTGCGTSNNESDNSFRFELPQAAVRAQVIALAKCPSPLQRLKIAAAPRQVMQPSADTIVLTIPASDAPEPITLRFRFDSANQPGAPVTKVLFHLTIPHGAQELDLGPEQVIAPGVLSKELTGALKDYFELGAGYQTARPIDNSVQIAKKCAEIGRLLDDGAVLISPGLAQELKRQRRRDALGWLFKDDYQLRTDAPSDDQGDYEY